MTRLTVVERNRDGADSAVLAWIWRANAGLGGVDRSAVLAGSTVWALAAPGVSGSERAVSLFRETVHKSVDLKRQGCLLSQVDLPPPQHGELAQALSLGTSSRLQF